ncbi:heavy metal translocating P-type ATPase [Picosynechococcus sp. PCC 11901]|uniref:heavy metal translocating P-type ATPase n=1 Tax=Picosynechococcus sp. PCC 11901 TaxID=2579791 RepID=UPI0010FBFD85|nr:heavy metal translocating P-type ATPase [Picosynechococcus sp. PCC 11901]QCS50185.1 heavy metal translocating P-type ATPase [Picosynechococcus sp. PCC 11901]
MTSLQLSSQFTWDFPFDYKIVHQLVGRLRLKLIAFPENGYGRLSAYFATLPWVETFRINPWAASVVIYYRPEQLRAAPLTQITASPPPKIAALSLWTQVRQSSLTLPLFATALGLASNQWESLLLTSLARLTLLGAGFPVAQRAIASLWQDHKLNIDCLDLLALIFSGWQGKLVTPALVITLHELGDLIREQTARATERTTANLMDTIGRWAWVEREGEIIQIESDRVQVGETVIVYPGERIPVDGVVIGGEATVDQQQLTGESMPIVAQVDTEVYAATLLRSGKLRIRCERVGHNTRAALSVELLEKAPVHDTRMANYAAQLADKLILPSLVLASMVYGTTQDPTRAASILTLDFVTGVRVSMPTAFLGALNHTTRHGILVRSGRTLELLAEIDTIVFDKTGTLTQGKIAIESVTPWGTWSDRLSPERLLQLAASAEQRITHPVAEAIVHHAQQQGIELLPRQGWDYQVGFGIKATIEGQTILVGSATFLEQEGICPLVDQRETNNFAASTIYVASDQALLGWLAYTDPLRPESASLIAMLQHEHQMAVHVLTGDSHQRAHQVALALKIPAHHVHAEAFPEDKARIVRNLRRSGRVVAFVGDGLNDSVALAYADVSISFADGSDIARETADVVLMNNDLGTLLEAIAIAKETQALIEQNTLLVVAPNMIGLGLAATVGLNPLWATVIHNGTAIAAGLNSLRPLLQHQLETMS